MDRILVVEDDPAILRGLCDNLRGETYGVLTSLHGVLRAEAPRHGRCAADLAVAMNAALHATLAPGRFGTLVEKIR